MSIGKDICIAAGLSAGGKLRNGNLVEGSWDKEAPFGCFIYPGDYSIHYNNNQKGTNPGNQRSLCHELPVSDIDSSLLIRRMVSASICDNVNCLTLSRVCISGLNGMLSVTIISSITEFFRLFTVFCVHIWITCGI